MIPVLVNAETVSGVAPITTVLPYTSQVVCDAPPIRSLPGTVVVFVRVERRFLRGWRG